MKIEKNIPMPDNQPGRGFKYPFPKMEVGDSFFVDGQYTNGPAIVSARHYGKKYGAKFQCRTVEGGVRIWRIE